MSKEPFDSTTDTLNKLQQAMKAAGQLPGEMTIVDLNKIPEPPALPAPTTPIDRLARARKRIKEIPYYRQNYLRIAIGFTKYHQLCQTDSNIFNQIKCCAGILETLSKMMDKREEGDIVYLCFVGEEEIFKRLVKKLEEKAS